jgi:hypothetical protein
MLFSAVILPDYARTSLENQPIETGQGKPSDQQIRVGPKSRGIPLDDWQNRERLAVKK